MIRFSELHNRRNRVDSFDHHADFFLCFFNALALTNQMPAFVVAGMNGSRRHDQVAHTG